ncbi:MAG: IclR family transcriptional regulator [Chloroflexota bacterium]|jgi:IclR family KDG regulon transcriptional repressor
MVVLDPEPRSIQKKARPLRAVQRVMAILGSFSIEKPELGISEISVIVGLTPSSVYRVVASLERGGFLEQNPVTGKYRLGLEIFSLGSIVLEQMGLGRTSYPFLEELSRISRETVNLGILRQGQVMYVQKIESPELLRAGLTVGSRVPAHCTAIGKALLAHLPENRLEEIVKQHGLPQYGPNCITSLEKLKAHLAKVREQGYSVDDEELEADMRCIGAPIWNHMGVVIAGIAIAGPARRMTYARLEELRPAVLKAAEGISQCMGFCVC